MSGKGLTPSLVEAWLERELDGTDAVDLADKLRPLLARIWEDGHADFEDMANPYGKPTDYALEGGRRD
jgi:hypothetical protein